MNEANDGCGRIGWAVWTIAGIAVLVGAIFWIASSVQKLPPAVSFDAPYGNCAFSANDGSATYSATITGKTDYHANVQAMIALVAKYNGELLDQSVSSSPYPNNALSTSYTTVNSTYFTATIPFQDTAAFMSDVANETPSSSQLGDVNYENTPSAALHESCNDAMSSIRNNEAMLDIYFHELPTYIKGDAVGTSTITYDNGAADNVDDLNQQMESAYSSIDSGNDQISQTYQTLGQTSVTITVQDVAEPTYPSADTNDVDD